jgi:hypothetical protein
MGVVMASSFQDGNKIESVASRQAQKNQQITMDRRSSFHRETSNPMLSNVSIKPVQQKNSG